MTTTKFKKGDRVRAMDSLKPEASCNGQIGTVVEALPYNKGVRVLMDDTDEMWWLFDEHLTLLETAAPAQSAPQTINEMTTTKFKKGDRVTGTVHSVWPNGVVHVQLDDMMHFTSPPAFVEGELALEADCETDAPTQPAPQTIDATLDERGKRYGKFTGHAEITQSMKWLMATFKNGEAWERLAPDQKEALEMIAHKIGRIMNGDPNYADNWVDIAGYAKLVADRLEGVER